MTSLLIGCGNLGKIILDGFQKKDKKVFVLDNNSKVKREISKKYGKVKFCETLSEVKWKSIKYIMICVKPKFAKEILNELKNFCEKTHIIISFVAGLKTNIILKYTGAKSEVVRIMPNIFIETNNSATAIFTKNLNHKLKKKLKTDFSSFGILIWIYSEKQLDFFTAMFGGGPAYLFFFLDCLNRLNKKNGIKANDSFLLLGSLLEGTLKQIKMGNTNFEKLISKVASKGGTTEEALKIFSRNQSFYSLLERAIIKAKKKSLEISEDFI